ncbi:MAG TPA: hypothetical protein VIK74_05460 [Parasegetibacter sp.]|jgi:hypothetical protein
MQRYRAHENDGEKTSQVQIVRNYVMGVLYFGVGAAVLFSEKLGLKIDNDFPRWMLVAFAVICFLYGTIRIIRAIKKA